MRIFPKSLKIHGQCISSEALSKECYLTSNKNLHLNSPNTQCDLQTLLSEFQVIHQYAVNPNVLKDIKKLTNPCNILTIDLNKSNQITEISSEVDFNIIDSGVASHVLYWYELDDKELENSFEQNFSNSLNQFAAISLINEKIEIDQDYENKTIFMESIVKNDTFVLNYKCISDSYE